MKYPYIGKREETGNTIIFLNENQGIRISEPFDFIVTRDKWKESAFKNITAEYLADTYGEVKSKEHAEFIVKLCQESNIPVVYSVKVDDAKSFMVSHGCLNLFAMDAKYLSGENHKQITIPLPPECESVDEWPKVGDEVEWGHTGKGEVKSLSDGFAWIKLDNKDYTTVYVSSLRKPKTPEQELNEELYELCLTHCDSKFQASEIALKLMDKYNITKKGEGDD